MSALWHGVLQKPAADEYLMRVKRFQWDYFKDRETRLPSQGEVMY